MCRESVGQHFIIFLGNFYETSGSSFQPRISYKAFLVNLFFRSLKIKFQQQLSNYQKKKKKRRQKRFAVEFVIKCNLCQCEGDFCLDGWVHCAFVLLFTNTNQSLWSDIHVN